MAIPLVACPCSHATLQHAGGAIDALATELHWSEVRKINFLISPANEVRNSQLEHFL